LGKFLLVLQVNESYDQVVAERANTGDRLSDVEQRNFGFDHADVGAAYMRHWHFPELFIETCAGHHESATGSDPLAADVARVALADYLANTIDPPASDLGFACEHVALEAVRESSGIAADDLARNLTALDEARQQAKTLLDLV
jgi:HD-like signal output (HDOD) protein